MTLPTPRSSTPGGVGVEGAGVADLAGAEQPAGLGHHVVARPPGRLVDDREAVGTGHHVVVVDVAQHLFEARRAAADVVGLEHQLGRALHPGLATDGALEAVALLAERLEHLVVVVLASEGVEVDDGAVEVAVDVDGHDRDELEALVVDLLELLGEDLLEELVEPGRARIVAGGGVASVVAGSLGHSIPLS